MEDPMLETGNLEDLLHLPGSDNQLRVLLCLAVNPIGPRELAAIRKTAIAAGWTAAKKLNLSMLLKRAKGLAILTPDGWKLTSEGREHVAGYVKPSAQAATAAPAAPRDTGSVIPVGLATARGYLEKVVLPLNASYDAQLYDCCAVMCRRLLETLIIEVYEHCGRASEIKGTDGHFLMLNGLATFFESDKAFNMSRNGLKGLRDFKNLGDLSAHNRWFIARKEDIDRVRDGLRVAVEELVHLAKLA
jgi:hypothetical protein